MDSNNIWCDKCRNIIRKGVTMIKDDNSTLDFCFDCCLVFFRPAEHKSDQSLRDVLKQEEEKSQKWDKLDVLMSKLDLLLDKEKDNPPSKFTLGTSNPNPNPSTSCFPLNNNNNTPTFVPPPPTNNFTFGAPHSSFGDPKPSPWSYPSS